MSCRIVIFGATGYTGRLVTAEMVGRGIRPVIAGRNVEALDTLAAQHGDLDTAFADASDPLSVRALIEAGDVLVTTVGPFTWWGDSALDAAIDAGAHYLDVAGEAGFIRRVIGDAGPRAQRSGSTVLTAFGYDYVPGHIAAALAVDAAGSAVSELQIVYSGPGRSMSSGTRAAATAMIADRAHQLENGHVVERATGRQVMVLDDHGTRRQVVLMGGTEPLTATRQWPGISDVSVWLDLGPLVWLAKVASYPVPLLMQIPALQALSRRFGRTTGTGPSAEQRSTASTVVTAIASDSAGRELARSEVRGPGPYDLTATTLTAGAIALIEHGPPRAGALGPLELFGHLDLPATATALGLVPV